MKRSRFTESQIVRILKEVEGGRMVKDVCREYGMSDATYYNWKAKYGGMELSDVKRLKELEKENRRLKQMYADLNLENLKYSPLLLTLAARIYEEKQSLPPQRAELYKELVERSLEKSIANGLSADLGEKLNGDISLQEGRLVYLAQRMTAAEQTFNTESMEGFMSDHFQENEGLTQFLARTSAETYLEVMGRRSRLLIGKKGNYKFLHSTVREYLTAVYLLESKGLQEMIKQHWNQPRYEEVLAFALSIRSAKPEKSTEIIDALSWLVDYGAATYKQNPQELFAFRRSPLRTALHLVRSAGLVLADFPNLFECLCNHISISRIRKIAVAYDSRTPDTVLIWLAEVGDVDVQSGLAANPSTLPDTLKYLARVPNANLHVLVAAHPNTPPEVHMQLMQLTKSTYWLIQITQASNPNTPPEALKYLAEYGNDNMKRHVASNPNTPGEVLMQLAELDSCSHVIASNPNSSPKILKHLAKVSTMSLQVAVALNPNSPPDELKHIAKVGDIHLQALVAENSSTPPDVLKDLAEVDSDYIMQRMSVNKEYLQAFINNYLRGPLTVEKHIGRALLYLKRFLARNPSTPREALIELAKVHNMDILIDVAKHPNTLHEVFKYLVMDIQIDVAKHPNTPHEVLEDLAEVVGSPFLQRAVIYNNKTPPWVLKDFANFNDNRVLESLAYSPNTPPDVLKDLANSNDYSVLRGVAYNHNTSPEVLEQLVLSRDLKDEIMKKSLVKNPNVLLEIL